MCGECNWFMDKCIDCGKPVDKSKCLNVRDLSDEDQEVKSLYCDWNCYVNRNGPEEWMNFVEVKDDGKV